MVTYRLSAKVLKTKAYIVDDGLKMIIPNILSINRSRDQTAEKVLENSSFEYELEGPIGPFYLETDAQIPDGQLFHSKVDNFYIFQYERDEELVAITLNQNVKSCGRTVYRTGIPGIHVMLLDDRESFLKNQKLRLVELEDDVMFEAELRGAMNSLELNTDGHLQIKCQSPKNKGIHRR